MLPRRSTPDCLYQEDQSPYWASPGNNMVLPFHVNNATMLVLLRNLSSENAAAVAAKPALFSRCVTIFAGTRSQSLGSLPGFISHFGKGRISRPEASSAA